MLKFPCNDNDFGYNINVKNLFKVIYVKKLALSYTTCITTKSLFEYFEFVKTVDQIMINVERWKVFSPFVMTFM